LNGWQRISVTITVIWFCAVAITTILTEPSDDEVYYKWSRELTEYLIGNAPDLKGYTVESLRAAYANLPDQKLIDALRGKYIEKHPAYTYGFDRIDKKYMGQLSGRRTPIYWANRLALAVLPPLAIYLAGWSVAWIRRGFAG